MKRITTRELVNKLINRGMAVTFRERKDGGIRITSINGVKYRASAGNTEARRLTNAPLSRAQLTQRRRNNRVRFPRIKVQQPARIKKPINLKGINKFIKKIGGAPLKRRKIDSMIKKQGLDKVRKDLMNTIRGYLDFASEASAYWVSDFIAPYAPRTASRIRELKDIIPKEVLNNIKEAVYHFANKRGGVSMEEINKLDNDCLRILNEGVSVNNEDLSMVEGFVNE